MATSILKHRVAALQAEPAWVQSEECFARRTSELVARAAQAGAELVTLPAHWGWALLGSQVGFGPEAPYTLEALAARWPTATADQGPAQAVQEATLRALAQAAQRAGVWLVGGSLLWAEQGRLYQGTPVIAPDGAVRSWQWQTHLAAPERALGLSRGETLAVTETPIGRLGVLLGEDVLHPEVGRILCLLGANLLVHPGAWTGASEAEWLSRLWREVQANQVFGVESVLVGQGYSGHATVHAPLEMTEERNGILAQSATEAGDEVVVAELDMEALQGVIDHYPIYDSFNETMYARHFPGLYGPGGIS